MADPRVDALAELLGIDDAAIRRAWSPTPAFMALFPKLRRLAHAQPFVDPAAFKTWAKRDDRTISAATSAALDPATHSDPVIARAAGKWVHPLLAFPRTEADEPAEWVMTQIEELEPAQ